MQRSRAFNTEVLLLFVLEVFRAWLHPSHADAAVSSETGALTHSHAQTHREFMHMSSH